VNANVTQASVAVLTYHSISRATTSSFAPYTVDPALFDEHVEALQKCGIDVIPFSEVPIALSGGRQAVAISIDDGLADAAENAAPALLRHGLPATLFVPSGYVGGSSRWMPGEDQTRPMLTWDQVADLARAGFEIGSHGRLHLAADVNPSQLVEEDARASRIELEDRIGHDVRSFAYPFGYHAPTAREAVRAAGFAQACAVGDLPARAGDDRWALPRLQVRPGTTPEALLAMVTWQPSRAARALAHTKQQVWRAGRRWAGSGRLGAGRAEEVLS
jgi:peptidoglycan/xylan/chitin deacetylase (PgdA/CDA1 family)